MSENVHQIKIWVLAFFSFALFSLDWWILGQALYSQHPLEFWLWFVGISALAIAALNFFIAASADTKLFLGTTVAYTVVYFLILPKNLYVILGGLLFLGLSVLYFRRIRSEERDRIHFSVKRVFGGSLIIMIYALLLVLGFNIYFQTSRNFKLDQTGFYDRLGETVAKGFSGSAGLGGFEIDLSKPLDEVILQYSDQPNLSQIEIDDIKNSLADQLGISLRQNESAGEIIARTVVERIKDSLGKYEEFLPLIFTLIILALLRTFAFVFYWLTLLVCWVLFQLLRKIGFFRISKVAIEVEKLEI